MAPFLLPAHQTGRADFPHPAFRPASLQGLTAVTGEILRGSLLERTVRNHARGCAKCASGEGHQMSVLTVSYPGGRTRQFSLRGEMAPQARRWLANYQRLKASIEAICELNHELLRPDETAAPSRRKRP